MKNKLALFLFYFLLPLYVFSQDQLLKQKVIDLANRFYEQGLIKKPYHSFEMRNSLFIDTAQWAQSIYFKTALLITEDLIDPTSVKPWFTFDAVSKPILDKKILTLRNKLSLVKTASDLESFFSALVRPIGASTKMFYDEYQRRLLLFKQSSAKVDRDTLNWLKHALAVYKWIDQLEQPRYLIVDIGSAELRYVVKGVDSLVMRAVVGKPSTPTPFFASWTDQLVLYPYWHVPMSIAVEEFLPKIKRNRSWLQEQNMQVIDRKGFLLDADTINWRKMNSEYFPYTLRQSTGCDNALGVLKLEFSSPYGVYIHDTNNKASFLRAYRFLSHGCIRIEEPLLLGHLLLNDKIDTSLLQSCLLEQKSIYKKISSPIPVFVIYTLAHPSKRGGVSFTRDVYRFFN
jgi:L,D-transpeptidase YcbB